MNEWMACPFLMRGLAFVNVQRSSFAGRVCERSCLVFDDTLCYFDWSLRLHRILPIVMIMVLEDAFAQIACRKVKSSALIANLLELLTPLDFAFFPLKSLQ